MWRLKGMKTIAVLTSGGDSPGMNAAVRAVVRTACENGIRVLGVVRGYNGLINGDFVEMDLRSVSDIIHRGGTKLYSARSVEFATEEGMRKAIRVCRENGIEGVVVIGGDGSFMGARALANQGIPCVGIPGTIDNDIACSEYTIGYDTAMNTAVEAIDKLRDTTQSHDRCSVVEVMGHHAGYIALNVGIATGALAVLLPERPFDFERDILQRMRQTQVTGKKHFIIIVSEGVTDAQTLANQIQAATGVDSRATVLGHIQRGGSPTVRDRVNASLMGYHAVDLLDKGIYNRVVALSGGKIVDYDVNVALSMHKYLDPMEIEVAQAISI
jgi:6-phosphofructokinase 1